MEYDLDDSASGQDNSNLSAAGDEDGEYFSISATPHILEFSPDGSNNYNDNDDDSGDHMVINDDSYSQDDSILVDGGVITGDPRQYVGHQFGDDSQSSADLPIGEDAEWREDDSVPYTWKVKEFLTKVIYFWKLSISGSQLQSSFLNVVVSFLSIKLTFGSGGPEAGAHPVAHRDLLPRAEGGC